MADTDVLENPDDFGKLREQLPRLKQRMERAQNHADSVSRLHHITNTLYFVAEFNSTYDEGTHEEFEKARGALETLDLYLQLLEQDPELLQREATTTHNSLEKLPPLPDYVRDLMPKSP